jgi:hypothetical protein
MTALFTAFPHAALLQAYRETPFGTVLLYFAGAILLLFILSRMSKSVSIKKQQGASHNYFHFEDFQLSAQDFYKTVEEIIKERAFPDVDTSIKQLRVGGFFSAERDYLVIRGGDHIFYVCAAPFGKNFFISYFLKEKEVWAMEAFFTRIFGGPPNKSFYEIDSEAMFLAGIKSALMKAINTVTESRGGRKLQVHELIPQLTT